MSKRRQEWKDISSSLAPENLYEDGELDDYEAEQKRKNLITRAKALYWAGYPCPKDVLDMTDDEEALQPFVEETDKAIRELGGVIPVIGGTDDDTR